MIRCKLFGHTWWIVSRKDGSGEQGCTRCRESYVWAVGTWAGPRIRRSW